MDSGAPQTDWILKISYEYLIHLICGEHVYCAPYKFSGGGEWQFSFILQSANVWGWPFPSACHVFFSPLRNKRYGNPERWNLHLSLFWRKRLALIQLGTWQDGFYAYLLCHGHSRSKLPCDFPFSKFTVQFNGYRVPVNVMTWITNPNLCLWVKRSHHSGVDSVLLLSILSYLPFCQMAGVNHKQIILG